MLTSTWIRLQYVPGTHTIISDLSSTGNWTRNLSFGNWSTAEGTRSLSSCSLPRKNISNDYTLDLALLFYANPIEKLAALALFPDSDN